ALPLDRSPSRAPGTHSWLCRRLGQPHLYRVLPFRGPVGDSAVTAEIRYRRQPFSVLTAAPVQVCVHLYHPDSDCLGPKEISLRCSMSIAMARPTIRLVPVSPLKYDEFVKE